MTLSPCIALERLVEAKEAHLEREARTADHFHRPVEMEQAKVEAYDTKAEAQEAARELRAKGRQNGRVKRRHPGKPKRRY